MEVNCVDPALKVRHRHSEQLSQRPNVDPSNIDEALGIGNLVKVERRGKRPWGTLARAGLDLLDAWSDGDATPHDR